MPAFLRTPALALLFLGVACSGPATTADGGAAADAGPGDAGNPGHAERQGCLSGAEYPCDCDGGPTGAMLCLEDGGFAACQCPLPQANPDGGNPDVDAGLDAGTVSDAGLGDGGEAADAGDAGTTVDAGGTDAGNPADAGSAVDAG